MGLVPGDRRITEGLCHSVGRGVLLLSLFLALVRQLFVLGHENTGGGPPLDGDARGLLQGPASQFEGERRPFLVLTDERVENLRRCSQCTGIGRPAEATEFRLNDTDLSLARAGSATQGDSVRCEDVNDELEELLDGVGGRGPRNPLRLVAFHRFVVASLCGDTDVEPCAAGKELMLIESSVRGRPGRPVDADAVAGCHRLVCGEGYRVEGERALPDRQGIVTAQAAIEE